MKSVVLWTYYNLDGEYIPFPENPMHGKEYRNVEVGLQEKINVIHGVEFITDVICIEGEEPIECELVGEIPVNGDSLIIKICQDWG